MGEKKEQKGSDIELYHRETNDILGDMPNWLFHTGSYIVYGIIITLLVGAYWFKYPDTVYTSIIVDDSSGIEWITAPSTGMIETFLVNDGDVVKVSDTIGVLRNEAVLEDIRTFHKTLQNVEQYYRTNDIGYLKDYPITLKMGDMTMAYEQFTQAVRTCLIEHEHNVYPLKKAYLQEELEILYMDSSTVANKLAILNIRKSLLDLDIEQKVGHSQHRELLEIAYENITNSLHIWNDTYLIRSRTDGKIVLGERWTQHHKVSMGDTIAFIMKNRGRNPIGHIRLSQQNVAEIAIGNKVNIELSKYPARHYGYVIGEVSSISYIPSSNYYALDISLPYGLHTTLKTDLSDEIRLEGKAKIITTSRNVLSRIFSTFFYLVD